MVQIDEKVYGQSKAKLEAIFDAGTFVELGAYTKRPDSQTEFESVVCGYGSVDGALVFAFVQDSGRTKGAFGERHAKKIADMYSLAVKNGAPVIAVFDSAGAVVFDGASALAAYGRFMKTVSDASGIIPQIAVVDGVNGYIVNGFGSVGQREFHAPFQQAAVEQVQVSAVFFDIADQRIQHIL